jgi:uncharacterized protein YsxB (DUF464 family)
MTLVKIYQHQDFINQVTISGHALSGKYGSDVVCAGISTVITGLCNALVELSDYDENKIIFKEGYVNIPDLNPNEFVQLIINVLIVQLKTIEKTYSNYIEISYIGGVNL